MSLSIEDGKGQGYRAEVNSRNQLQTRAIVEEEVDFISNQDGLAFSWSSGDRDIDASDTLLLVKNTSSTRDLHVDQIIVSGGNVATRYTVHLPTTEVTVTGTTITGVNLNTNSSNVAEAEAATDETNNVQGNIIFDLSVLATTTYTINTQGLILGTNSSIGIDQVTESTAGNITIVGHYLSKA